MPHRKPCLLIILFAPFVVPLVMTFVASSEEQSPLKPADETVFIERVQPLFEKFCLHCHNADKMTSGVRVDQLTGQPNDNQLFVWKDILKQVSDGAMPPEEEPQPSPEQREFLAGWIRLTIEQARKRNSQRNGSVRRLTVAQYQNSLQDLLGLRDNLTTLLPPDGISKDGFVNNGQVMVLSPLQMEHYFEIAERALDLCLVDESCPPVIQNFRMDLGAGINQQPCPDKLILGADSLLLENSDFVVSELTPVKPFHFQPFEMQKTFEYIEGYVGNDTIRGMRKFEGIYHNVFACMRGTRGYPKGDAYQVVPDGLLLRPAIPSSELFGESSTYGPQANFKVSLRELPERGNFRVTVRAARYDDGLLLNADVPVADTDSESRVELLELDPIRSASLTISDAGVYQVDVVTAPSDAVERLELQLGGRYFSGGLNKPIPSAIDSSDDSNSRERGAAFLVVRLNAGPMSVKVRMGDNSRLRRLVFTRLSDEAAVARNFQRFEQRSPLIGVHLGLRRDCGSTLSPVGGPREVGSAVPIDYVFEGAINDFPSPDVEKDNLNYLAGVREIGVRSEYTDGRDLPRLLIRSVEFEGPLYESWPPVTHRRILFDSSNRSNEAVYAREVIEAFTARAYRRPVTDEELSVVLRVWENSYAENADFRQSIKDALLVVLTSPQFLFLIENSSGPQSEELDEHELAAKLSYFLWNAPPDDRLGKMAAANTLRQSLNAETVRMMADSKFQQFVHEFASQWLSLEKFDVLEVDAKRFPKLTRAMKMELRKEPVRYLAYLFENNLPLRNLVESDVVVVNDAVASYYDLGDRIESGSKFVAVKHGSPHLGGLLSQASILAGLSDGREANPVKRGAWLARKIIADPPDDPPPNVPELKNDEAENLTLRQKLERHRSQPGCVKCHSGIDPWGLPFEAFDASGLRNDGTTVDTRSQLPDGTEIRDLNELKEYLAGEKIDQVAFSFLKHLATYAVGRSLNYNEIAMLQEEGLKLKPQGYRVQDLVRFVVQSDLFLKK